MLLFALLYLLTTLPVQYGGLNGNHGGLAVFYGPSLSARFIHLPLKPTTSESMICILKTGTNNAICAAIYRPGSQPVTAMFMDEFSTALEVLATYKSTIAIVGDFNILCDVANDAHAARFLDLMDTFGLQLHVIESTHISGHILDFIIIAVDTQIFNVYVDLPILSDHGLVTCNLPILPRPVDRRCLKLFRRLNKVDKLAFSIRVQASSLSTFPLADLPLDALCASCSTILRHILDVLVPAKAIIVKDYAKSPRFGNNCRDCRRLVRLLKRCYKLCESQQNLTAWKDHLLVKRRLYAQKSSSCWTNAIQA